MSFWLRWGGILLGAISLFSLVQRLGSLDLAPIFQDMLKFYRAAFYPIIEPIMSGLIWMFSLISIKLPQITADVIVIYVLLAASFWRASYSTVERETLLAGHGKIVRLLVVLAIGIGILIMLPFLLIGFIRLSSSDYAYMPPTETEPFRNWPKEIAKVIVAFLIIFGTNAYFTY